MEMRARYLADPRVSEGTGFGKSSGLRVSDKIFAIFGADTLTLKLPRARVDELTAAGLGIRFDPGHGRLMREWLSIPAEHGDRWIALADEALAFVGSK